MNDQDSHLYEATVTAGAAALKSAILINGGASVALLTYLGYAASQQGLPEALLWFVCGTLAAAMGAGSTYVALLGAARSEDKAKRRWFQSLNTVSIVLVIASYSAFAVGAVIAYCSFP